MKTLSIFLFLLCFTVSAQAEKVRVYTDYTPIRIMYIFPESDPDLEANKAGLSGSFKEMDSAELPSDRTYRDAWKVDKGSVKVDNDLKTQLDEKKNKKTQLVGKLKGLGLEDEEIKLLQIRSN